MSTDALYEQLTAGELEPSPTNTAALLKEAEMLDLGDHVRIRGSFFTTSGRSTEGDPWPTGYTGTIRRGEGILFDVALHAIPVTLYYVMGLDLAKVERRRLSGLPAAKPLHLEQVPRCGHCDSTELLHVQEVEEIRDVLGVERGVLQVERSGRKVDAPPSRPRVVCLACDREWVDPDVSFS